MLTALLPVDGQEKRPSSNDVPIFMRVSLELFDELTRDTVKFDFPFNRSMAGLTVTGKAKGKGQTRTEPCRGFDQSVYVR